MQDVNAGRLLRRDPVAQLDVDLGADDRLQFRAQRVDHRTVGHVGQRTLSAAPGHLLALYAPVPTRPATHRRHLGIVDTRLPVHPDWQLPANRRLPIDWWLARVDRRQVQRAARAAGEPGAVEEDAGAVDNAGGVAGAVAEHAPLAYLAVTFEAGRVERRR